jgi:hypothetical protein
MKLIFYSLFALFFISCTTNKVVFEDKPKVFPQDYFGAYYGKLKIDNGGNQQEIDMEFHLQATDSVGKYSYTIVYGSGENRQERKYFLIEKNATTGAYVVDEDNGILLNAKFSGNTLYSMFEVQGGLLTSRESFFSNYMDFEITYSNKAQQEKSGDIGEEIPEVISYPITVVQTARLYKK